MPIETKPIPKSPSRWTPAGAEKIRAAAISVVAAFGLTILKAVVGFLTGSLALLADALHSLFDLGASLMTIFSVSYSDRPPDADHNYGHGKMENLTALAEVVLLTATCGWIFWEAVRRLIGVADLTVEASIWGIVVMLVAILVDWQRSRALMRTARKHKSHALEADALHFASDMLSSMVVIFGLVGVRLGIPQADPIAALFVAFWVGWIALRLGYRSIRDLLDTAPAESREAVRRAAESVEGVVGIAGLRVRQVGPRTFADLSLRVDRRLSLPEAHQLADRAEQAVRAVLPGADIVVHAEPTTTSTSLAAAGGPIREAFEAVAGEMGIRFHHIRLFEGPDGLTALVDLEFPGSVWLADARERADALERAVRERAPALRRVVAHLDVDYAADDRLSGRTRPPGQYLPLETFEQAIREVPGVVDCHDLVLTEYTPRENGNPATIPGGYILSVHLVVTPRLTVVESHEIGLRVERALCERFDDLRKVHIHQEPAQE